MTAAVNNNMEILRWLCDIVPEKMEGDSQSTAWLMTNQSRDILTTKDD